MTSQDSQRRPGTVCGHCPPKDRKEFGGSSSSACMRDDPPHSLGYTEVPFSAGPSHSPRRWSPLGRERALEGCLTWHFPVNLLEHSPVPVPGAINTLGSEKTKSGHPLNRKPQKFFLPESFLWPPLKWAGCREKSNKGTLYSILHMNKV